MPKHVFVFTEDEDNEYFLNSRNAAGMVVKTRHLKRVNDTTNYYGRSVELSYDQLGRTLSHSSNDAGDQYIGQSMTYYGTSEVATLTSRIGAASTSRTFGFTYDDQHQLIDAFDDRTGSSQYHSSFTYTPTGRLLSANVTGDIMANGAMIEPRNVHYEYADADPEIVTSLLDDTSLPGGLSVDYTYDDAGNMTQRSVTGGSGAAASVDVDLIYDAENRLRIRKLPDGTEERYFYDGPDRWLAVEIGTSGTATGARIWFGGDEIEYACTPLVCERKTEKRTITLGGRTVARIDRDVASDTVKNHVVHTNGLGHTLGIYSYTFDGSALSYNLEVGFQYGPFGEILETFEAPGADANAFRERFNGKTLDTSSGLSYYGYRYFDPLGLIWNRSDPLFRFTPEYAFSAPRKSSLYAFTANNPIRYVDPDGLTPAHVVAGVCARAPAACARAATAAASAVKGAATAVVGVFLGEKTYRLVEKIKIPTLPPVPPPPVVPDSYQDEDGNTRPTLALGPVRPTRVSPTASVSLETVGGRAIPDLAGSTRVMASTGSGAKATREIALGRDIPGGGYKVLGELTGASTWRNWARDGITRRTTERFGRAFSHAVKRAKKIHFSLDGIDDPAAFAQKGRRGFVNNRLYSAAELFIIKNDPKLLDKTVFYRGGNVVPSPF